MTIAASQNKGSVTRSVLLQKTIFLFCLQLCHSFVNRNLQVDEGTGSQQLLGNVLPPLAGGNHKGGSTLLIGNVQTARAPPDTYIELWKSILFGNQEGQTTP